MTVIDPKAPVLVTGGSGYIASWIIRLLLEEGRTVHATVRDPAKESSVAHLERIAAEAGVGALKLFKADLLEAGSFDAAMQGCEVVMHTASPFLITGFKDANEALVRPAVEGTRNVLEAVNRTASVNRVVLTSSIASVYGDSCDLALTKKGVFDETEWNTTSSVDHQPYSYSKVAAEREAWRMHDLQKRWDLVTINPSMVYGPSLTTLSQSTSIDTLIQMGNGKLRSGVPRMQYGCVDVRDVARAHLLAGFKPEAKGRYIVSAASLWMMDIANILRKHYGSKYPFPKMQPPKFLVKLIGPYTSGISREFVEQNVGHKIKVDNSRSQENLGLKYRPIEDTFVEHFQQVIEDDLLKKRAA